MKNNRPESQSIPARQHSTLLQPVDRRGFLHGTGLIALAGLAAGGGALAPIPAVRAQSIAGKSGLTLLNDRPLNAETPAHLLDDPVTPAARHFVRNNGIPPSATDPDGWRLRVDGLVDHPLDLGIEDLRRRFEVVSLRLVIECAGNGRAFFDPAASGNQWTYGAVGCSTWTGVRLHDVLQAAGVRKEAIYTAHEGADRHLSGDPGKAPLSRGLPLEKAMRPETLIAFAMNGGPIHPQNGAPLRLVVPGWPGSCSQKWLTRIWLRDRVHDGAKMGPESYRVPAYPVAPGQVVPPEDLDIIEAMPVKSIITHPRDGVVLPGREVEARGHAWAGDRGIREVAVTTDYGASWQKARLEATPNPGAWQAWHIGLRFPRAGYYEIWARAVDEDGVAQPFTFAWNQKGYLNNWYHRVRVTAV